MGSSGRLAVGCENDDEESVGFFSGSERKYSQRKQVKERQLEKGFSTKTSFAAIVHSRLAGGRRRVVSPIRRTSVREPYKAKDRTRADTASAKWGSRCGESRDGPGSSWWLLKANGPQMLLVLT